MSQDVSAGEAPLVAVLDYGIGNLRSAQKTLERVGANPVLTRDPEIVRSAAGVVLPGVGNFGRVMEAIRTHGVDELVDQAVSANTPFLGICVGMQALFESSEEVPDVQGLGILSGAVRRLTGDVKRPQMQWNTLHVVGESRLLPADMQGSWVYFVHSYAPEKTVDTVATCDYGGEVVAAVERDNVFATQFHPEKSGPVGLSIVERFVTICRQHSSIDVEVGS